MPSKVGLFGPDDKSTTIWSPGSEVSTDGCANVYSSLFVEGYFYKVCPTGFSSNQLYLTLPAGFVQSTISQEDATQAARDLLAAKGAELAEAQGVCTLGEFQEVFSTVDATFNWDWVADKAVTFPRVIKNTLPNGTGFGTGDDSGIMVQFPKGNSISWPLMIGFFYQEPNLFLANLTDQLIPNTGLRIDIHNDYGLMHMDFMNFMHDPVPNLCVYAGRDENKLFELNTAATYVHQNISLYCGKLVADYGSREIYGPAWDEDLDGPADNPFFEPDHDVIPEFTIATLGGFLFRIDTASRSIINGKLAGVYLVCYKDDIQVYKYDALEDDYVSVGQIPFNPKNTTTYYGASILFDGTNKFLEIYLDGQFELSIADDTLTNIHLPVAYQRGVYSMDHWIGDITSGQTYPGTNRLPPPITTRYFEPTDILLPDVDDPGNPGKKFIWPSEPVGGSTALEANKPYPKLRAGEVGQGFKLDLEDFTTMVSSGWGGAFFGGTTDLLTNYALTAYPELGKVLWGAHTLQVGKTEMNRYSSVEGIPSNPYKFLMTALQITPVIPVADIPDIDWPNYPIFDIFLESYQQHPRWNCSWDGVFQPSDLFEDTADNESDDATEINEMTEDELPVFQAGLYPGDPRQKGDGWLYTSSMINMLPGRVFSDLGTGNFKDLLTKDDITNHYYYFGQGWFGSQVITDLFTAIRTVKLMTGVQGKRTSEPLEPPEYDFNYVCPTSPVFPPLYVNLPCLRKEYEIVGTFGPISGGTHFPLVVETYKDCLFGDPYADVCYPSRSTWFAGFNFIPSLQVVFNSGQGIEVQFNPEPSELLYGGARILQKLHTEFIYLDLVVYKEGWPGTLYTSGVAINLQSLTNDPPAEDIAYSTAVEACYFVPGGAVARYDEDDFRSLILNQFGDSPMIDLVEVGARYRFVFTLHGV